MCIDEDETEQRDIRDRKAFASEKPGENDGNNKGKDQVERERKTPTPGGQPL